MPLEIFVIPAMLAFVIGFYKSYKGALPEQKCKNKLVPDAEK
jgi:hypothetical protein